MKCIHTDDILSNYICQGWAVHPDSHIVTYIYIYIRLNTSNCYLRFDVISQPCSKCSFDPLSRHGLQGQDALEEQMDKDFGFCIDEDCFQVFSPLKDSNSIMLPCVFNRSFFVRVDSITLFTIVLCLCGHHECWQHTLCVLWFYFLWYLGCS